MSKGFWSRQLPAVVSIAIGVAGAAACSSSAANAGAPPAAPPVAVVRLARGPLARTLTLTAELRPYQEVDVHAKVAGFVRDITVDVGSRVREGDLLATLDVPELADDAAQADAAVGASESEITRAEAELKRAGSAHDLSHQYAQRLAAASKAQPGLVAQQDVDDAASKDQVAEAQISTATAAVASAKQQLAVAKANQARQHALFDYARITAPFAGVVTKRYADKGTMIQAGTTSTTQALPLVRIAEDDHLRLVIPVPESAVAFVKHGGTVAMHFPSLGVTENGTVARIADQVDPATRTMHVEVDVANADGRLVAGMYAEAVIVLQQIPDALRLPVQAIDRAESVASVLAVTPKGVIERRAVTLGLETADAAEVRSGLQEGDLVVIGTRAQLRPGATVQPIITPPASGGR
jgi:RND family efflux transporter MFP subunit